MSIVEEQSEFCKENLMSLVQEEAVHPISYPIQSNKLTFKMNKRSQGCVRGTVAVDDSFEEHQYATDI